jgi:hypothetical protein
MIERTIFLAALDEEDPARRRAYLDQACTGDAALRRQVEALLAAHARAGTFLDVPAVDQAGSPRPGGGTTDTGGLPPAGPPPAGALDADVLALLAPAQRPGSLGRLDHYEVLELIGRGGMGLVFRAFDEKLQRIVAIKALALSLATNATARRRFVREARAAAAVTHDNVIDIHAVEDSGPVPFLVMQFINGCTLQQKLDGTGPLSLKEVLRIGLQTAAGLAAAHHQGLTHRDVKPSNILLENGVERVKLTDFGLARAADEASLTQSGVIAGTPQYMSPEQAEGKAVDHRSDLFSLGSVLYACCTGRAPFRAGSAVAALRRVCDDTPRPIREANPEIPHWLCDVIGKLHAKNLANRFQSAAEVAEVLRQHLARLQQPTVAPEPTPALPRPPAIHRMRWLPVAVVLVGLLAALALTEATGMTDVAGAARRLFGPNAPRPVMVVREPAPTGDRAAERPEFPPPSPAWLKQVVALAPEKQLDAVALELKARNPAFDGRWAQPPGIDNNKVASLVIESVHVRDLSPLRGLPALRELTIQSSGRPAFGVLEDLRPLKGLSLDFLRVDHMPVADLSPLRDLPLTRLRLEFPHTTDLTPLKDLPLTEFHVLGPVTDLSPLSGMKQLRLLQVTTSPLTDLKPLHGLRLEILVFHDTHVEDLSPLKGMPLKRLNLHRTRVKDLSPLKGMKLEYLNIWETPVEDVSVLKDMPLREVNCDFRRERDEAVLRVIKTLQTINGKPAAQFWNELPAEPDR